MKTNAAGVKIIKDCESLKLSPYLCPAGIPTIGYGSIRYEDGTPVTLQDKPITKERAEELLQDDLKYFENEVSKTGPWNENEFSALVSFVFNVKNGHKKLLPGSTLGDAIATKDKQKIADAFLAYNKAVVNGQKVELPGLTKRRTLERNLFLS